MSSFVFKDIDDDFLEGSLGDFKVIVMKKNDYINISKLVSLAKTRGGKPKLFASWKKNYDSQDIIDLVVNEVGLTEKEIIIEPRVVNEFRGTYVHNLLVLPIITWASPSFAIKINMFLEEWRNLNQKNDQRYWTEMGKSLNEPARDKGKDEKYYSDLIAEEENGKREVETDCGFIDVLTDSKVIEVKQADNWKHAVGQVLMYGISYQEHEKWLYLFFTDKITEKDFNKKLVDEKCLNYGILVRYV